jgi:chromosome segregation ATPase
MRDGEIARLTSLNGKFQNLQESAEKLQSDSLELMMESAIADREFRKLQAEFLELKKDCEKLSGKLKRKNQIIVGERGKQRWCQASISTWIRVVMDSFAPRYGKDEFFCIIYCYEVSSKI